MDQPTALAFVRRLAGKDLSLGGLEGGEIQVSGSSPMYPVGISTGEVWHYTDVGGLRGILESNSFWASSFRTMNDPGEIGYGLGIITEVWKSMEAKQPPEVVNFVAELLDPDSLLAAFEHVHLLSASRDGDSLSQWRSYAGTDGVSLGLAARSALSSDPSGFDVSAPNIWGMSWIKVAYRRKVQIARCELFLHGILRDLEGSTPPYDPAQRTAQQLQTILQIVSFKHPAFVDERELRSTVMIGGAEPPVRQRGNASVPYVPLIRLGPGNQVQRLPLTAVRYGPTATAGDIAKYRQVMVETGYGSVPLIGSEIPFR
ncbi:hypothetical protein [Arthrobacter sp.]|uniref:DUF2971 domain-containing protein n=1 Tax=Arthrobacter sp. TaxID=1667 RepID=UPI00339310AD